MRDERITAAARIHRLLSGLPQTPCDAADPEATSGGVAWHTGSQADGRSTTTIVLPPRRALESVPLDELLARRRSTYRFGRPLGPAELSDLLGHACGPQEGRSERGSAHVFMTAPSAGGLASLDVYVVDLTGSAVPAGVYHYERNRHELSRFRDAPAATSFAGLLTQPEFVRFTTTFIILVARMDRTMDKYPLRHYRTLHVDAGVMAQNVYLTAAASRTGCCAIAGFHDDAVARLLRLPDSAFAVLMMAVGRT